MNRFDRALAILLLLRGDKTLSATELARRFEVSRRTIYRDVETLSAIGVPIYAEMGRTGGFRLLAGYFLPPVMFTPGEAISLLVGLTLLHSLHATPFASERETAEQKLLAAVPDHLRAMLVGIRAIIGFEQPPDDSFHPEPPAPRASTGDPDTAATASAIGATATIFLQAVLDHHTLLLDYHSPYAERTDHLAVVPLGLYWDRDRWYLAGRRFEGDARTRLWRADRVQAIKPQRLPAGSSPPFDIRDLLGRTWLRDAMRDWRTEAPVVIRITRQHATRLQQDWYYRHARYEDLADGETLMTFGEENREIVLELLRWLGPGAELITPRAWRPAVKAQLLDMLAGYIDDAPA